MQRQPRLGKYSSLNGSNVPAIASTIAMVGLGATIVPQVPELKAMFNGDHLRLATRALVTAGAKIAGTGMAAWGALKSQDMAHVARYYIGDGIENWHLPETNRTPHTKFL